MDNAKKNRRQERGMALMLALFFVSIAVLVLGALATRLVGQAKVTVNFVDVKETFFGLEAGYAQAVSEIESAQDGLVGVAEWEAEGTGFPDLDFESETVDALTLASLSEVNYFAVSQNWYTDGIDNNGDNVQDDSSERYVFTIYAAAQKGSVTRRLESVVRGSDVNVWRNAIFAGSGQAGGLINGNVSVHGSVHLLGNNVVEGNIALAALDLSGTSLIHNNYDGMPANLRSRIPDLLQYDDGGVDAETLEAKLRVKNGLVGLSGNSEIGQINVAGDSKKDFMDGTFVNDGWTGNAVIDDGDRGDPTSVYSDNGWDELYDLGDRVPFPVLSDDWRDPDDGHRESDPDLGGWYSHEDYFREVLLADSAIDDDGVYVGDIVLNAREPKKNPKAFYWNATHEIESDTVPSTLPPDDEDYMIFDPVTDTLRINGQIEIDGNLTFTGQGSDTTIYYSGRAAFLVNGDVTIDTDLLTANNGNPSDYADSFPVNNIIGIMAREDMHVGSTSQLSIMGAFYAQGQIASSKQTNVAGTFVSNYFDMGTNVPAIFQVPPLADNLPRGMIGDYPILSMQRVSWREL